MRKHEQLRLVAAFASIYIIWGSTYLAIRFAIETLPPFLMAAARFGVAGVLLYAWARLRGAPRPNLAEWRGAAIVGTLLMFGGNGLVTLAEQTISSGTAALLVATMPLWMAGLDAAFFSRTRPSFTTVAGLGIGLVGVATLIGPSTAEVTSVDPFGAGLVLLAASLWALGSLLSRRVTLPASLGLSVAMQMLAGTAALLIAATLAGEWSRVDLDGVSMKSSLAFIYLVVFGSIVAIQAYVWLLRKVSPAAVSTYAFVNPAVAVLLGWLFAGETIGPRTGVAAALIVFSVVLILLSRRSRDTGVPADRIEEEGTSRRATSAQDEYAWQRHWREPTGT